MAVRCIFKYAQYESCSLQSLANFALLTLFTSMETIHFLTHILHWIFILLFSDGFLILQTWFERP